jgi:hypothetical protein
LNIHFNPENARSQSFRWMNLGDCDDCRNKQRVRADLRPVVDVLREVAWALSPVGLRVVDLVELGDDGCSLRGEVDGDFSDQLADVRPRVVTLAAFVGGMPVAHKHDRWRNQFVESRWAARGRPATQRNLAKLRRHAVSAATAHIVRRVKQHLCDAASAFDQRRRLAL